ISLDVAGQQRTEQVDQLAPPVSPGGRAVDLFLVHISPEIGTPAHPWEHQKRRGLQPLGEGERAPRGGRRGRRCSGRGGSGGGGSSCGGSGGSSRGRWG